MASTNKTANLGLNQWVESDPFLREDANADNSKIDAAIGGLNGKAEFIKLKDITSTASGISQIDIDVSDIHFSDWQYIMVDVQLNQSCYPRVNNDKSGRYIGFGYSQMQAELSSSIQVGQRLIFMPHKGGASYLRLITIASSNMTFGSCDCNYKDIKTVNFVTLAPSSLLNAGNKFIFWGVK